MAAGLAERLSQWHPPCAFAFRSSESILRFHPPLNRISFTSSSSYSWASNGRLLLKGRNDEAAAAARVLSPTPPAANRRRDSHQSSSSSSGSGINRMKDQKWIHEGVITESLPNGMFRVRLENEDEVLGYISGKIRKNSIRIVHGDRVKIEVSRYDSSRGRITFRL